MALSSTNVVAMLHTRHGTTPAPVVSGMQHRIRGTGIVLQYRIVADTSAMMEATAYVRENKDYVDRHFCRGNLLNRSFVNGTFYDLENPHYRRAVFLMYLPKRDGVTVPDEIRKKLGQTQQAERVVAAYVYDVRQPTVLEFLCVNEYLQRKGIGSIVFKHWRDIVMAEFNFGMEQELFVVSLSSAENFYRNLQFRRLAANRLYQLSQDKARETTTWVVTNTDKGAGPNTMVTLVEYQDTVLMSTSQVETVAVPFKFSLNP